LHRFGKTTHSYSFPLTDFSASYRFSNPEGIIVYVYGQNHGVSGTNFCTSYYYFVGSGMRNLSAAFTANDIPSTELECHSFQEYLITFVANIKGIHLGDGNLKWYINSALQPDLTNEETRY